MIKFFSKIRRQLLEESLIKKYVFYASGEILLVVIGILIALQINNWNTDRINRIQEKEYLSRIVQDLKIDLNNLEVSISSNDVRILRGVQILEMFGCQDNIQRIKESPGFRRTSEQELDFNFSQRSFGMNLLQLRYYQLFEENDITVEEIISSGKLDIISTRAIKNFIQEHYALVKVQKVLQRLIERERDDYTDLLRSYNISMYFDSSFEKTIAFIKDKGLLCTHIENFIHISIVCQDPLRDDVDSIKKSTENLIIVIEEYLING